MATLGRIRIKAALIGLLLFSCVVYGVAIRHEKKDKDDEKKDKDHDKKNNDKKKGDKGDGDGDSPPAVTPPSPAPTVATPSPAGSPPADTAPAGSPDPAASAPAGGPPSATAPAGSTPVGAAPSGSPATPAAPDGLTVFDVSQYGAKADDKTDSAISFIKAWRAACASKSPSKLLIPKGNFVAGPVLFQGPCTNRITVQIDGIVKASTDLSEYTSPEWFSFERITGLTVLGTGTLDGQGASAWKYNDCAKNGECAALPDQLKFIKVTDGDISQITSLNSKYFHYHVYECTNVHFHDLNIVAPGESPNTDGLHISNSQSIKVSNTKIGTGDDCVSVGEGTNNLTVTNVQCGPGHGLSVGSLGKVPNEDNVNGILISDCTLTGTTNGARIKTYAGSTPSTATGIVFQNLLLKDVKNPVIIDSHYGSKNKGPSKVKLNDVHFRNIKGTTISTVAVNLDCSSAAPCDQVELTDIDLTYSGAANSAKPLTSTCANAKVKAGGVLKPGTCSI